jgi:hypothetical protein
VALIISENVICLAQSVKVMCCFNNYLSSSKLLWSPQREDRDSIPGLIDEPPAIFRTEIKS